MLCWNHNTFDSRAMRKRILPTVYSTMRSWNRQDSKVYVKEAILSPHGLIQKTHNQSLSHLCKPQSEDLSTLEISKTHLRLSKTLEPSLARSPRPAIAPSLLPRLLQSCQWCICLSYSNRIFAHKHQQGFRCCPEHGWRISWERAHTTSGIWQNSCSTTGNTQMSRSFSWPTRPNSYPIVLDFHQLISNLCKYPIMQYGHHLISKQETLCHREVQLWWITANLPESMPMHGWRTFLTMSTSMTTTTAITLPTSCRPVLFPKAFKRHRRISDNLQRVSRIFRKSPKILGETSQFPSNYPTFLFWQIF